MALTSLKATGSQIRETFNFTCGILLSLKQLYPSGIVQGNWFSPKLLVGKNCSEYNLDDKERRNEHGNWKIANLV